MRSHSSGGPAVILCEPTSVFAAQLAAYWRAKGMDVVLVTHRPDSPPTLPDGTRIVCGSENESRQSRVIRTRLVSPLLHRLEWTVPWFKRRFTRITGAAADSEWRLPNFAEYVAAAWPTVKTARALRPRFVFGHEVTTYGLPTALCSGVPKIIFPWGSDVLSYAESSPFHFALTKLALLRVDLIVPSSTTAAEHIRRRFGIRPEKVRAISWGVDREKFKSADATQRMALCARWNINPQATVVLNPRRFRPAWGGFLALEAFMQVAAENPLTHFVLFGGAGTEEFTKEARTRIERQGLSSRFTLLEGFAPSTDCVELMSISDVFVSLLGRFDMRSSSVLQAAAAGAAPIIAEHAEYHEMERLGFAALFVQPDSVEDVVRALRFCILNPEKRREMIARNDRYLAQHEDYSTQMDILLGLIDEVCARY
ncbi:MAG TPA: glycosyltransferase [Pyrinomonadaceae bacterium]|nr:glycosyltransferase [Pyrinomonadaceae bacterium]